MSAKPLVSLILPAFNEEPILKTNTETLLRYIESLREYRWEVIIVNDGSRDATAQIADDLAAQHSLVRVVHHARNYGLGQAMKTGFAESKGDYVVTMDVDLSYSQEHIGALLERISKSKATMVLASPYMEGGSIGNVPLLRKILSVGANWFLSIVAQGHLSTLTCMVRAYDGPFVRSIHFRQTGMDVMPETIYKTMILRGKIEQIPAVLDWGIQQQGKPARRSSMRIMRHTFATLLSGFIFRPFMFFILPGLVLLAFSAYVNAWMIIHFFQAIGEVPDGNMAQVVSDAVSLAYDRYPHTFIVGLLSLMLAIQLVSLGILALQSKAYFEETFHLGTEVLRVSRARLTEAAQEHANDRRG